MKQIFLCILVFFCALPCVVHASELTRVSRTDTKDVVQLYFSFDETPEFTSSRSERRIDIEFYNTTMASSLSLGEPDSDIVKILPRPTKDRFILSLFFRYRPQQHKVTKSTDGKLVLEVLLGNEYSKSYQDLADNLKGLTVVERISPDSTNPYLTSPYAKDWMSFFALYESPVEIDVPVTFTLPPFPVISLLPPGKSDNLKIIDSQMMLLAEQNLWDQLAGKLQTSIQTTQDIETQKLLALTYGEVLSRSGNFDNAYRQLYLLKDQYSDELLGTYAQYLLIHLRSVHEDPFVADNEYRLLEKKISKTLPLAPYFLLSQIETALATKNFPRLNRLLLRDDVAYPKKVEDIVQIRQADYWYVINQPIKAQAAYQLLDNSAVLQTLPFSLSGACNIYYDQKKFTDAATCYEKLSTFVLDTPVRGLVDYRKNMAKLKVANTDKTELIESFADITKAYPHTNAAFRAAIKRNDLLFLQNTTWGLQAIHNYEAIAAEAISRPIREEALFKQALVNAKLGDAAESIRILQKFLREFLVSDVRISAQALLIELLPAEIKRLVDNHDYIQPLVLAKQNKLFFQKKWIDSTFLVDIAKAYNQIGIYDEAQKLYLYLIGIMPEGQKEEFFLPMLQATFDHGDFPLVEDYAAQYTYTYPKGRYAKEILFYRLQALVADERLNEALQLLPDPLPETIAAYELSVSLFFRTNNYKKCLDTAKKLVLMKNSLSDKEQFMYAESLFKTESYPESEQAFLAINRENEFYEQSLYRLAELARQQGNEKKALSFFEKLVEIEKNSLWKQYAERELQFAKTAARN